MNIRTYAVPFASEVSRETRRNTQAKMPSKTPRQRRVERRKTLKNCISPKRVALIRLNFLIDFHTTI